MAARPNIAVESDGDLPLAIADVTPLNSKILVIHRAIRLVLAVLPLIAASPARSADGTAEAPWELVAVGPGIIAVPRGWRNFDNIQPGMVLYRSGDGIGVPALDETKAPLQIGLTVEKFPGAKGPIQNIMNRLIQRAQRAPRLELVGKESVESIELSDGTEALLLTAEFIKEGRRRSLQIKLVVKDTDSTAWIVSGHLVGAKESKWPTPESGLAKWLRAHLTSLNWDQRKFDEAKLRAAYKNRDRR